LIGFRSAGHYREDYFVDVRHVAEKEIVLGYVSLDVSCLSVSDFEDFRRFAFSSLVIIFFYLLTFFLPFAKKTQAKKEELPRRENATLDTSLLTFFFHHKQLHNLFLITLEREELHQHTHPLLF